MVTFIVAALFSFWKVSLAAILSVGEGFVTMLIVSPSPSSPRAGQLSISQPLRSWTGGLWVGSVLLCVAVHVVGASGCICEVPNHAGSRYGGGGKDMETVRMEMLRGAIMCSKSVFVEGGGVEGKG